MFRSPVSLRDVESLSRPVLDYHIMFDLFDTYALEIPIGRLAVQDRCRPRVSSRNATCLMSKTLLSKDTQFLSKCTHATVACQLAYYVAAIRSHILRINEIGIPPVVNPSLRTHWRITTRQHTSMLIPEVFLVMRPQESWLFSRMIKQDRSISKARST